MTREVYIAAPWVRQADAQVVRERLQRMGHTVTSRWLDTENTTDPAALVKHAQDDLMDIHRADTLVALEDPEWPLSAGRLVEFGFALARGKHIFILGGGKPSIFHTLPQLKHIERVEDI